MMVKIERCSLCSQTAAIVEGGKSRTLRSSWKTLTGFMNLVEEALLEGWTLVSLSYDGFVCFHSI